MHAGLRMYYNVKKSRACFINSNGNVHIHCPYEMPKIYQYENRQCDMTVSIDSRQSVVGISIILIFGVIQSMGLISKAVDL